MRKSDLNQPIRNISLDCECAKPLKNCDLFVELKNTWTNCQIDRSTCIDSENHFESIGVIKGRCPLCAGGCQIHTFG